MQCLLGYMCLFDWLMAGWLANYSISASTGTKREKKVKLAYKAGQLMTSSNV